MNLEKLIPRFNSFLPYGLFFNSRNDFFDIHGESLEKFFKETKKYSNEKSGSLIDKNSKWVAGSYEGFRAILTGVACLHSPEAGLITYTASSYLLDKASSAGFIFAN
jgi:hypothetical protein